MVGFLYPANLYLTATYSGQRALIGAVSSTTANTVNTVDTTDTADQLSAANYSTRPVSTRLRLGTGRGAWRRTTPSSSQGQRSYI